MIDDRASLGWRGAALGIAFAICLLGAAIANGDQIPSDRADDLARARDGEPGSLFALAERFEQGLGVDQDLGRAALLYDQAAKRGHRLAQYRLALALVAGIGIEQDVAAGYRWLTIAAGDDASPDPLATTLLGRVANQLSEAEQAEMEAQAAAFEPQSGPVDVALLPTPAVDKEGEGTDQGLVVQQLARHLDGANCGPIRTRTDADEIVVAAEIATTAGLAAPAPSDLDDGVELRLVEVAPAICDTLRTLATLGAPPDLGVQVRNQAGDVPDVFSLGDHLVIDLPSDPTPRYVNVDYYVHDGVVLHLLPNDRQPDNLVPAEHGLTLGQPGEGGQEWQVSPPYGNDLIVVLSALAPLPLGERPEVEATEDYLAVLRRLPAGDGRRDGLRTGYQVVRTVEAR